MRVISRKALQDFAEDNRLDSAPFDAWFRIVTKADFPHFAALRATFGSVDTAGEYFIFDIGGNKYRIIAAIHFNTQKLYVRHVLTHAEYEKWKAR